MNFYESESNVAAQRASSDELSKWRNDPGMDPDWIKADTFIKTEKVEVTPQRELSAEVAARYAGRVALEQEQ